MSQDSERVCEQPAAPSTSFLSQMMALRRFGEGIGLFWRFICYAGVLLALLSVLVTDPAFYATPRGWAAIVLAACYLAAFTYGSLWIAGCQPDTYWKQRLNDGIVLQPWRAVTLWAVLLAISAAMIGLNHNFVWLIWVPFGMSLSLLPMPRSLLMVIPTGLLAMAYYGELPTQLTPPDLLKFGEFAFGLSVYCAVIYLPLALLRGRILRERTFQQLEQSHRELELAHQRLEEAAVHERELAVLRERGRLARDMHDTLGHSLALITVKLEAAQRLRTVDPARADHEVAATQAIARSALSELRESIANLRASGSTREPLGEALMHAAQECAGRAGWHLISEIAPDIEPISDHTYEALLRTGLEALANIERHANARMVCLTVSRQGDMVSLRVEDDGIGILTTNPPRRIGAAMRLKGGSGTATTEPQEDDGNSAEIVSPQGHYGITGMRERTTGVGGTYAIGAGKGGQGTRIEALVPANCA